MTVQLVEQGFCWSSRAGEFGSGAHLLCGGVRQAAEHRVYAAKVHVCDLDHGARRRGRQRRKHVRKLLARGALRGEGCDVDVGVVCAEANDLCARVARRAQHSHVQRLARRHLGLEVTLDAAAWG